MFLSLVSVKQKAYDTKPHSAISGQLTVAESDVGGTGPFCETKTNAPISQPDPYKF
jgi:hypothetical protein